MPKKDAIQDQDVSQDQDDNAKPTPELNPRNSHLDELTKRAREEREQQMEDQVFDPPKEDEPAPEPTPEPEHEEEPKPKPDPTPKEKPKGEDDDLETLKVEGSDVQVPRSKIFDTGKRALQKELAADHNLEEAKKMRAEASALLEKAKEKADKQSADVDLNDQLSSIADRIQFGDKEEGAAAIKELTDLVGSNNAEKVDMDALSTQVVQQVEERREWQEASAYVEQEYSDVIKDPILFREFQAREDEARNKGDKRPYKELYTAIAEDLRGWRNGLNSPTTEADPLQDRRRRKQESSAPPGGHSAPAAGETQPAQQKGPRDIIAEMRQSRGQS